jgi:hypothetical protein
MEAASQSPTGIDGQNPAWIVGHNAANLRVGESALPETGDDSFE